MDKSASTIVSIIRRFHCILHTISGGVSYHTKNIITHPL